MITPIFPWQDKFWVQSPLKEKLFVVLKKIN